MDDFVPGNWRCPKCNFRLVQSALSAFDGSIGDRDQTGEKCPNDGAPLWRVSKSEYAAEMAEMAEMQKAEQCR
jgi:uncharacterized protein with PIN domain